MSRRRVRCAPPATCFAGGLPRHARPDWLGSERLAAWTNQTLVSEEAYAPFGGAYAGAGAGEQMFTGKGQRLAAGIYDFPFRHYSPAQGRWLSPDPSGPAAVNPANPQSWNAYAYVASQPLTATDPLGLSGNGSTGCGVGQAADGPCPPVYTVTAWGCITCNPGPPPGWVDANLTGIPYCTAHPLSCMVASLGQHPNGPGPSGSWNHGNGVVAAAMAVPKGPSCSPELGWASVGAWIATGVSFLGEAPSLGADSPVTLAAGSAATGLSDLSLYIGAAAAALNSLATGNARAIGAFDWSHLTGLPVEAAASHIPGVSAFGDAVGGIAELASSLSLAAREVCQ